ncbi:MAG: XrtA system polysaccharide chain length determinant [Sphingomonadaceae bacterium]
MNDIYEEVRIALHTVWLRRWLALAVAWGVALLGWLAVSGIPNKYESKASVFVQMQSALPGTYNESTTEQQRAVDAIQRTLTSSDNLEKVVRGAGLSAPGATARQIADQANGLRSSIEIANVQDNTFEITASSGSGGKSNAENAKAAKLIVQKLLDLFVEGNVGGNRIEGTKAMQFLDTQLAEREQQLQEAEAKRVAFEQKYVGSLPGFGSASSRMDAARLELSQLEQNLSAAQGAVNGLLAQLAATPPTISTPGQFIGGGGGASARVGAIEAQISEARSRGWTDSHPDMIGLRGQLAAAREAARLEARPQFSAGSSTPNPTYVTLRASLSEKQAAVSAYGSRKAQLQAEMQQFQAKIADEPAAAAEQQRLTRDYDVLKAQYDKLLQDREQLKIRISAGTETDSLTFKVLQPPTSPRSPTAPNRPLLLTMVLLAGLAIGGAVAFALAQIKSSYTTPRRLEKASGLTVIGSVSEVVGPVQRAVRMQRLKYFGGAAAALVGVYALLLTVEFIQRGMVA